METTKKPVYKLTVSAVFVALATVLSFIKVIKMPLGGSVTLLSMLPVVMISVMFGLKWGFGSAFVYALGQLALGLPEVLTWGLTPAMLIGTIMFDYIIAFTVLGIAGIFADKGYKGICGGVALAVFLRFVSHFISGYVIFKNLEQFEIFGGIAFAESARQIRRKLPQKLFTIRRSVFTVLFLLDNHSPDFVVGIDHGEVDSGFRVFSSLRKDIRNALKEVVVDRLTDFIVFHRCTAFPYRASRHAR